MNESVELIVFFVIILAVIGWVMNVDKFVNCDFETPYKCEVIHGIGLSIPVIGAVTGWMDFGK